MQLNLKAGENVTIQLDGMGSVFIQWNPESEGCLVQVSSALTNDLKISERKEPAFGMPSVVAVIEPKYRTQI